MQHDAFVRKSSRRENEMKATCKNAKSTYNLGTEESHGGLERDTEIFGNSLVTVHQASHLPDGARYDINQGVNKLGENQVYG